MITSRILGYVPLLAFPLAVTAAESPSPVAVFEWQNPIHFDQAAGIYGDRLRDPHIIRVGDSYYLTATMTPAGGSGDYDPYKPHDGSSPGVRLYSTKDFKTWKAAGWVINSDALPADCPYKNQCWATEIHHINGKFYFVTFAGNWKFGIPADCYIGVSDQVTGPYEHVTRLPGAWCDVTLTSDDAGKVYAFMIGDGIRVQQVDLSGIDHGDIKLVGPVKTAVDPTAYAERGLWVDKWTEGPWCRRHNEKYYLFYAVHLAAKGQHPDNRYYIDVSYADSPMGPWMQDERPGVFWGGHGSVFDGPDGRWWYSYKNEKFDATGEDFLCIDPVDFLPDGRIASSEPTPYNILTRIAPDGTVTRTEVAPKPVPVDQRPAYHAPALLPMEHCTYAARKLADWDFQRAADGTPLKAGVLGEGNVLLANAAGASFSARSLARPTGPALVKRGDHLVLDTSGGCLIFPHAEAPALGTNKNFSVWMRVMPLKTAEPIYQGLATAVGRWKIFRKEDGRLELGFGPHLGDILKGKGPRLDAGRWYDIGFSFDGDADPADLHVDTVTVYVDGKAVGTATGRGLFDNRDSFQIGCDWFNGNRKFSGLYKRVIFSDGVVRPDEFAALSSAPTP